MGHIWDVIRMMHLKEPLKLQFQHCRICGFNPSTFNHFTDWVTRLHFRAYGDAWIWRSSPREIICLLKIHKEFSGNVEGFAERPCHIRTDPPLSRQNSI